MEQVWQFAGSAKEGEPFEIKGIDVWSQGWQVLAGREAQVNDPVYGKSYIFRVYFIQDGDEKIELAAGEFQPECGDSTLGNRGDLVSGPGNGIQP